MNTPFEKFHPRNRRWPSGMPESIAKTQTFTRLTCNRNGCEYSVVIATDQHEATLREHHDKSCPLVASGTPGFEEAKEAKHNGRHEELVPVAPPAGFTSLRHEYEIAVKQGLKTYASGAVRSPNEGKIDYTLALDGPLFERLAAHLSRHAEEKGKRNWMNADSEEDFERFKESFLRHALQYLRGETDEDHFAALLFNANGMEWVRGKLRDVA